MGYFRGFVHGAAIGTVIGLSVAPQTGDKTRAQLKQAAAGVREGLEVTSRALQRVAPVASSAAQVVDRVRHRGEHGEENGSSRVRISEELPS
ncbi:MAG: YtxH domain-containing protein [Candidatus Dormibacteraeota bacterium]|nr:YtxH domain-containing protein [Candidatus Dormibacteraeota bacterium]MBV8445244.1 YtxH domain-containing protein [Candidatus Dormibacteraeota bacterium]